MSDERSDPAEGFKIIGEMGTAMASAVADLHEEAWSKLDLTRSSSSTGDES